MKFLSLMFIFFMSLEVKADVDDEYARALTRLIEHNNLQTTHLERALESLRQNAQVISFSCPNKAWEKLVKNMNIIVANLRIRFSIKS